MRLLMLMLFLLKGMLLLEVLLLLLGLVQHHCDPHGRLCV